MSLLDMALDFAYEEGYNAFSDLGNNGRCRYPNGSIARSRWFEGFDQAHIDDHIEKHSQNGPT